MQTFLPYADFHKSAKVLDSKRLGKQRVETWQIYQSLTQPDYGWKHHPIVKMWKGYEHALLFYGMAICQEWIRRGYKDTMFQRFEDEAFKWEKENFWIYRWIEKPKWLGNKEFHRSHMSNLLRKDLKYYRKYWKKVPDNLPYKWIV